MNIRHLGFLLSAIGGMLFISLCFLYFGRTAPEPVDTKKLLLAIAKSEDKPREFILPNADYLENLDEGLWGFERISRQNNRIKEGKYVQLCQDRGKILKQTNFWLNLPYQFMQESPEENFVTVRPSVVGYDKIQHHFALESLVPTKSGLKFTRHEVQIIWLIQENQYELVIREAYATFTAFHPKVPLAWLRKIRTDLNDHPLIEQGQYDEQKMIAFRLEDCNK